MCFGKKSFPPYKEVTQIDTKIAHSGYKVSNDQSQARFFVYSLLVSFYFLLNFFELFYLNL